MVRPRVTIEPTPSLSAHRTHTSLRGLELEGQRLLCAVGTNDHSWQAWITRLRHAAAAVGQANSLCARHGSGPSMRLRARDPPHREAVVGRRLGRQVGDVTLHAQALHMLYMHAVLGDTGLVWPR